MIEKLGLGVFIGLVDRNKRPIHIGDTLGFDKRVWYRQLGRSPAECDAMPDVHFVVELERGEITGNGLPGDWEEYCDIVKGWDE